MSKRQEHVAIAYDKRGKVISIGRNSYVRSNKTQRKYARLAGKPDSVFLHAEIDALVRARGKCIHTMFVSRVTPTGYALSKPCNICQQALKDFGVKHVRWT